MKKEIKTIGELRELIRLCEDDEPISYILEEDEEGSRKSYIVLDGASSTAGGRAVNLWFSRKSPLGANYSI